MPYLRARDGAPIYVRILGHGKPCVLLHGFGMQSAHWLPLIWPYLNQVQFILPDMRGFGRSHHQPFNQDDVLNNFAEDLDDILDALQLREVMLGGVSMGAYTGLQFHRRGGFRRVSHYLHIDQAPQCLNTDDWQYGLFGDAQQRNLQRFSEVLDAIEQHRSEPFFNLPQALRRDVWEQFGEFFAFSLHRPLQKQLARRLTRFESLSSKLLPTENWFAYAQCFKAYLQQDYDMRASVANLTQPTTLMVGMRSEMYPYPGQLFIAEQATNTRVVRFDHSGHALMYTEAPKFIRELGQFLQQAA